MSKRKSKTVATGKGKSGCASVNGSAATCEWYKGPIAKQCHRPATHEVLSAHWEKPVPVCDHHADITRGVGFQVRQNDRPKLRHEHQPR